MLKTQDRVFLAFEPGIKGTVTKVLSDGKFSVTWDNPARKRGEPRTRFSYAAYQADGLKRLDGTSANA